MMSKHIYGIFGLFVGAAIDLTINLISAGIQNRFIHDQFSNEAMLGLAALSILGLLVGYWLGYPLKLPRSPTPPSGNSEKSETVTITRLRALLSYGKLKGKGIHLSDVLLFVSRIDIDA